MTMGPGISYKADQAFSHLRRRVFFRRILGAFTRDLATGLLSFEQVRGKLQIRDQHYIGRKEIPIAQIVGSAGRYHEFDRAFLPTQEFTRARWKRIYEAAHGPIGFPPIDVYKIGDIYFVRDGHHRVSVLKELGATTVEADITELETLVPLSSTVDENELDLKAEYAAFLKDTGLVDVLRQSEEGTPAGDARPNDGESSHRHAERIEFTLSGQYRKLFEHIAVHRHYMGLREEREISYVEAATRWYCDVYRPVVELIREEAVLDHFPGRTEADLYLWIIEHRHYLSERYGQDVPLEEAASDFSREFSRGAGKKQLEAEARQAKVTPAPTP